MNDNAEFRIIGAITQKYVGPSGKFAFLKMETKINGFRSVHDMKTFDEMVCRQINTCGIGEMVQVTGELGTEVLKGKDKNPVEVDGRKVYVASLKVTSIAPVDTNAATHARTVAKPASDEPPDLDPIPF